MNDEVREFGFDDANEGADAVKAPAAVAAHADADKHGGHPKRRRADRKLPLPPATKRVANLAADLSVVSLAFAATFILVAAKGPDELVRFAWAAVLLSFLGGTVAGFMGLDRARVAGVGRSKALLGISLSLAGVLAWLLPLCFVAWNRVMAEHLPLH